MPKSQKISKAKLAVTASTIYTACAKTDQCASVSPGSAPQAASNDNRPSALLLDQYYTRQQVAIALYESFKKHVDPSQFLMIEPSAGTGAFFELLPHGSLGYDIDPKYPGIQTADFLEVTIPIGRPIAFIGNPPFGKNSCKARRFFNRAAATATIIAFILPRTFNKGKMVNSLHRAFHLIHEEDVPKFAFLFEGKPYNVPAVFQIWERRDQPRALRPTATTHPDFEFTTQDRADFAIQRVGAKAGRVHHDLTRSSSSTYFIKAIGSNIETIMAQLDFASVARNTAGNPSLAKSEIVSLYQPFGRRVRASSKP